MGERIFACTSTLASKEFKTGMTIFRSTLRKIKTAPMIISAFEMLFQSYRKGYKLPLKKSIVQNDNMSDVIQQIYDHQMEIGLKFFVQGFISSKWEIAQNLFLKKDDFNDSLTDWNTKLIRAIWKFSTFLWHSRCDFVHRKQSGKTKSARRKELGDLIQTELTRTKSHADHSTRQLRKNVQKSIGNARVEALEIWLNMLRNVKGETFLRKSHDTIRATRAQPITIFFSRLTST